MTTFSHRIDIVRNAIRKHGLAGIAALARGFKRKRRERAAYQRFITRSTLGEKAVESIRSHIAEMTDAPKISVIVPVYNVDHKWLKKCVDSVRSQLYDNWELCIADDASTRDHIRAFLEKVGREEPRIKVVFRETNGHISAASNSALRIATGTYAVLLDHDDELSRDALYWVANEAIQNPQAKMIFSDEDVIDEKGERRDPKFKPRFSPDLMLSLNMVTHLSAYRTDVLREVGGFREGLEGSQDYDLALRVTERASGDELRHIPRILYHWRAIETSVASSRAAKPYAFEKARIAIADHLERSGVSGEVIEAADNLNRVRYKPSSKNISLVIAGGVEELSAPVHEVIRADRDVPAAKALNDAASRASGEIVVFLDGDLVPQTDDWVEELCSFAELNSIGAAGGKILRRDGMIDQTGFILGGKEVVRKAHYGFLPEANGYFFRAGLIGNYSAVSWRAFAIRKEIFESVGGFRADEFPNAFFDVDLCLRLWRENLRVVYSPYAVFRAKTRAAIVPSIEERIRLRELWPQETRTDPFYNPNLSESGEPFSIRS